MNLAPSIRHPLDFPHQEPQQALQFGGIAAALHLAEIAQRAPQAGHIDGIVQTREFFPQAPFFTPQPFPLQFQLVGFFAQQLQQRTPGAARRFDHVFDLLPILLQSR